MSGCGRQSCCLPLPTAPPSVMLAAGGGALHPACSAAEGQPTTGVRLQGLAAKLLRGV